MGKQKKGGSGPGESNPTQASTDLLEIMDQEGRREDPKFGKDSSHEECPQESWSGKIKVGQGGHGVRWVRGVQGLQRDGDREYVRGRGRRGERGEGGL
jgi:hypothetical protein